MTQAAGQFTAVHRGGSGEPLVLVHGFTDTWRTWELVLPALEARFDVLAPTLAGHAGGPALPAGFDGEELIDALEASLDAAGFTTAHVVGNSLGGYAALKLAERGRARSVVALAPGGGWLPDDPAVARTMEFFRGVHALVLQAAPHAEAVMASPEGRRRATEFTTVNYAHLPSELLVHQLRGAAQCATLPLIDHGLAYGWPLDPTRITCPVRVVWGHADAVLPWPSAAARYREWLPSADWIELEEIGHCPQLDDPSRTVELIEEFLAQGAGTMRIQGRGSSQPSG